MWPSAIVYVISWIELSSAANGNNSVKIYIIFIAHYLFYIKRLSNLIM